MKTNFDKDSLYLALYEGGGYDGCLLEYNYFCFKTDKDAQVYDVKNLYTTGTSGFDDSGLSYLLSHLECEDTIKEFTYKHLEFFNLSNPDEVSDLLDGYTMKYYQYLPDEYRALFEEPLDALLDKPYYNMVDIYLQRPGDSYALCICLDDYTFNVYIYTYDEDEEGWMPDYDESYYLNELDRYIEIATTQQGYKVVDYPARPVNELLDEVPMTNIRRLKEAFPDKEPEALAFQLANCEHLMHKSNERYCNGEIDEHEHDRISDFVTRCIQNLFGNLPDGFFINSDPRGYALKIKSDTEMPLQKDWGGYYILSPDVEDDI